MSNSTAIAATTLTIQNLLQHQIPLRDASIPGLKVTTLPPDLARKGISDPQLNIFLYQTAVNAAWRNLDVPNQVRPGESASSPLALNLHYMLTAYGSESDDESVSHRVLGGAMSVLHDHPLLGAQEIKDALDGSGLDTQFERVRITPIVLPMDEMSKLWTALQSNYRLSAGYEITVLLIDSQRPVKASLPVLKRGPDDRGPEAAAARAPVLESLRYPRSQQAARLGDDVAIVGSALGTVGTTVQITHVQSGKSLVVMPVTGDRPGEIKIHVPSLAEDANALTNWTAGFCTLAVVVQRPSGPAWVSNEIGFALAPTITALNPMSQPAGALNLEVSCIPRVAPAQRVLLLFGDVQANATSVDVPPPAANDPSLAKFALASVSRNDDGSARSYTVRLRIDGVDSIPVIVSGNLPAFDPAQQVKIT